MVVRICDEDFTIRNKDTNVGWTELRSFFLPVDHGQSSCLKIDRIGQLAPNCKKVGSWTAKQKQTKIPLNECPIIHIVGQCTSVGSICNEIIVLWMVSKWWLLWVVFGTNTNHRNQSNNIGYYWIPILNTTLPKIVSNSKSKTFNNYMSIETSTYFEADKTCLCYHEYIVLGSDVMQVWFDQ